MNPTVSRNSTIRMNPTLQNSHTVTDRFNSLDQTNPGQLRGRSDRWSKGWMGLAGRLRAARPLRAARKTRPLHREQERGRGREKGQEMRTQSNPERQSYVKKNTNLYLSPLGKTGPLPREKLSRILLGKAAQDRYTKVIWPGLSNYWSMARPRLLHVMLPASITSSHFKTTHSGAARTSFFSFFKEKVGIVLPQHKQKKTLACKTEFTLTYDLLVFYITLPFPLFSVVNISLYSAATHRCDFIRNLDQLAGKTFLRNSQLSM